MDPCEQEVPCATAWLVTQPRLQRPKCVSSMHTILPSPRHGTQVVNTPGSVCGDILWDCVARSSSSAGLGGTLDTAAAAVGDKADIRAAFVRSGISAAAGAMLGNGSEAC
jgi:hypothetical protein